MFMFVFWLLFRHVGIPLIALGVAWNRFGENQAVFLVVNLVLTISTVPFLLFHIIKLVPNLALLRSKALTRTLIEIVIEVLAVVGFWVAYILIFFNN